MAQEQKSTRRNEQKAPKTPVAQGRRDLVPLSEGNASITNTHVR
jgi:hypothetical protein